MSADFSTMMLRLRNERGLSQRKAASELGISQALLSHYENGLREPRLDFVVKVCDYYDVSADFILGRTGISPGTDEMESLLQDIRALAEKAERLAEASKKSGK